MPTFLPDSDLKDSDNQEKLRAIWWRICSTTGAGKTFLQSWIPKLGADWKAIPNAHTTPEIELGALPQNFANLNSRIAGLEALILQLAKANGVIVDEQAIADATVDEFARRMSASTNLTGDAPEGN